MLVSAQDAVKFRYDAANEVTNTLTTGELEFLKNCPAPRIQRDGNPVATPEEAIGAGLLSKGIIKQDGHKLSYTQLGSDVVKCIADREVLANMRLTTWRA